MQVKIIPPTASTRKYPWLRALTLSIFGCGALSFQASASEPTFPSKVITIVVPTAAGGANDAMARIIAQGLQVRLGQTVVVDNKAGANGAIAAEFVARAPADGHTILFGYIATHGMNPALQKLKYDPITDFEPIGLVANSPTLMVATNSLPVKNAQEFVALTKLKPGSMNYASAGKGTAPHFAAELFKINTGADMEHVPYKGSAPGIVDTIGGTTQVMFPSLFTAYPQIKAGKIKSLGLAGTKRSPLLPDVPTLIEQGIPNVNIDQWYALFAPSKTPSKIIQRLNKEVNIVLNDKANEKKIENQGAEVQTGTPEELKALVKQEVTRWKAVVVSAKITAD
jgi:tripartite-type tricarboxylate transporter receptor subunit TctC